MTITDTRAVALPRSSRVARVCARTEARGERPVDIYSQVVLGWIGAMTPVPGSLARPHPSVQTRERLSVAGALEGPPVGADRAGRHVREAPSGGPDDEACGYQAQVAAGPDGFGRLRGLWAVEVPRIHDAPHLSRAEFQIELAAFDSFPASAGRVRHGVQALIGRHFSSGGQLELGPPKPAKAYWPTLSNAIAGHSCGPVLPNSPSPSP